MTPPPHTYFAAGDTSVGFTPSRADAEAAGRAAVDRFGRIDVLVNNAASFYGGYFEELTPEQMERQLATSLIGPMNVTRAVLPVMRKQRLGHIISISSSAGLSGFEFGTAYAASKFGLEGWMESLHAEVAPLGITTTIVNPGFFRTELLTEQSTNYAEPSIEDYDERRAKQLEFWKAQNGQQSGDPAKLARALIIIASQEPPPRRFIAGADAIATAEQKIADLKAQIDANRDLSALIDRAGERAAWRFVEFFTVNVRNKNTRAAYGQAAGAFLRWCEGRGIMRIEDVRPVHVAGYIEQMQTSRKAPTVKQHLACIRMLFDWLVTGQVLPSNPAHAVRGPRHSVIKGATTVMSSQETTEFLKSIDTAHVVGLRDRAFIGVMVYAFARVSAVVSLKVENYFPLQKRWWLRLREKGGKVNEMGCHHKLEQYLDEYIAAAGIAEDKKGPLFRAAIGRTGKLSERSMSRVDAWYMVRRRARDAGIETAIGNHSFRAIGITDYLERGGDINIAKRMAGHSNVKTTELYDRRGDEVSFSEIERVGI